MPADKQPSEPLGENVPEEVAGVQEITATEVAGVLGKNYTAPDALTGGKPDRKHLVILIHGIRTEGKWQKPVASFFEENRKEGEPEIAAECVKFGYFPLWTFIIPFWPLRNAKVRQLQSQMADLRVRNPDAILSVIAHSFGAYLILKILRYDPDPGRNLHSLIMFGGVAPSGYEWTIAERRVARQIQSEHSPSDQWPAVAQSVTYGYTGIGSYGAMRSGVVKDVHRSSEHNGYVSPDSMRRWKNYILDGSESTPAGDPPETKNVMTGNWWYWILTAWVFRLGATLVFVVGLSLTLAVGVYFSWHWLHPDPAPARVGGEWKADILWDDTFAVRTFGDEFRNNQANMVGTFHFSHTANTSAWVLHTHSSICLNMSRHATLQSLDCAPTVSTAGAKVWFTLFVTYAGPLGNKIPNTYLPLTIELTRVNAVVYTGAVEIHRKEGDSTKVDKVGTITIRR